MTKSIPPGEVSARATDSFFADARWEGSTRVCHGTSCALQGGAEFAADVAARGTCSGVYCLGYCDRSPALLQPDGRIATGDAARRGQADPQPPDLPTVRCLAPEPLVTARVGMGDHSDLKRARASGVWRAAESFLSGSPERVIAILEASGERGRGGAAYSTGAKWRACAEAGGPVRYAVANGDEGDPGSFLDRVLMEHDPHALLEGLVLCGFAIGAHSGIVYVRGEYPAAAAALAGAMEEARGAGLLGPSVAGSGFEFDVRVEHGRGSYVCGEETALLNSIEGRRGEVRLRPPYPATHGFHGAPTVVNNVETLVNAGVILSGGAEAYRSLGTDACSGTKVLSLNAGFARPGLVEVEFGTPLRDVIEAAGHGADGDLEAVLLGGPMGSIVPSDDWDVPICYEAMSARGIQLGHGGVVALHSGTDWRALLLHLLAFFSSESCGRCAPCRLGSLRALDLARHGGDVREELSGIFNAMEGTSLCAFGQLMPGPLRTLIERHDEALLP